MEGKKKLIRSTKAQIKMLVDYMSTHPHLANGEFTGPLGSQRMEAEWHKVKNLLRDYGPDKTVKQWETTWRDLKKKAREDNARAAQGIATTGNTRTVQEVPEHSLKILDTIGYECSVGSGAEESPIGRVLLNPTSLPPNNCSQNTPPTPRLPTQHITNFSVPTTSTVTSQSATYTQEQACDEVIHVSLPDPPTDPFPNSPAHTENIPPPAEVHFHTTSDPQARDSRPARSSRARGVGHAVVPHDFIALQKEANELQSTTNNLLKGISSALTEHNALLKEQNSILLQRNRILKRNR